MYQRDFYSKGRKLYRSRNRMLFGVCRGLAEWKDLPVVWVRFFTFLAFTFTGFFPVGFMYFIAALIIPIEPPGSSKSENSRYERRYNSEDDWERRFSRKKRGDE